MRKNDFLQGIRDGHDFIPAAMEGGAAAVLCSRKVGDYPAIYVEDPRIALGRIAREELKRIGCKVEDVDVEEMMGQSDMQSLCVQVSGTIEHHCDEDQHSGRYDAYVISFHTFLLLYRFEAFSAAAGSWRQHHSVGTIPELESSLSSRRGRDD